MKPKPKDKPKKKYVIIFKDKEEMTVFAHWVYAHSGDLIIFYLGEWEKGLFKYHWHSSSKHILTINRDEVRYIRREV